MKTYYRIVRPRFELKIITIDVDDEDDEKDMEELAVQIADEDDPGGWTLLPHDPETYGPHIQRITTEHDIEAAANDEVERLRIREDVLSLKADDEYNYMLLMADVFWGEGKVIFERWFQKDEPDHLDGDLCREWVGELREVWRRAPHGLSPTEKIATDAFFDVIAKIKPRSDDEV